MSMQGSRMWVAFGATVAGILFSFAAIAQEVLPDVLVKTVTLEVIEIIGTDKDIQSGNQKKRTVIIRSR